MIAGRSRGCRSRWLQGLKMVALAIPGCGGPDGAVNPPQPCDRPLVVDQCPPAPPPPPVAIVVGEVRDDFTTKPVPGATVAIGSRTAATGQDGRFQFDSVPIGAPQVSVTAPGFETWSQPAAVQSPSTVLSINVVRANSRFETDGFLLYLPPPGTTIRGVFLHLYGNTGDSRPLIRGDLAFYQGHPFAGDVAGFRRRMIAFAGENNFALMGAATVNGDTVPSTTTRLLQSIETVSSRSGRLELATAALIINGHSLGGCIGYRMAVQAPERVIGFITAKSTCMGPDNASTRLVPGYLIHGELDHPEILEVLKTTFERNRSLGAPWAFVIEPGAYHATVANHDLLFNWLADVASRRLPPVITPGTSVTLRSIDERSGWLGDSNGFAISAWSCYTGKLTEASWFPSERTARDWLGMISRGTPAPVIPCGGS
jgi:pimeloyl-ACP methyl ester carboxylesterase